MAKNARLNVVTSKKLVSIILDVDEVVTEMTYKDEDGVSRKHSSFSCTFPTTKDIVVKGTICALEYIDEFVKRTNNKLIVWRVTNHVTQEKLLKCDLNLGNKMIELLTSLKGRGINITIDPE